MKMIGFDNYLTESGQQGHIQYSQIRPKVETKPQLELAVLPSDDITLPLKQFESQPINLQITNHSERNVDLNLEVDFDPANAIQWNCASRKIIGVMSPGEKKTVNLSLIPTLIGQHALPGITLNDSLLNHDYNYTKFATLLVE